MFEKYKPKIIRLFLVGALSFVMALMMFMPASAADYSCGAYGRGTYDNGAVCASTTTGSDSGLVNTGQALLIAVPAGMIVVGTFLLYRLSRKRKSTPPPPQA